MISTWFSDLNKDTTVSYLPSTSFLNEPIKRESNATTMSTDDDDLYLGWTLFKSIDRPELGLKEEKPRIIHVKHLAQTYVVGIPEEYADEKTKSK